MTNCEICRHTIRLSNNCPNFDVEIVTIVRYLKSLLSHMNSEFATTQLLNMTDDELVCGQWN